jgi:Mn-dependent DtxR family transcriptional regulator
VNRDWMRERLESFLELCEAYDKEYARTTDYSDAMQAISDRMAFQMPTVREILKRLDPALAQEVKESQDSAGPPTRCEPSSRG